jgi:hypothetical protein
VRDGVAFDGATSVAIIGEIDAYPNVNVAQMDIANVMNARLLDGHVRTNIQDTEVQRTINIRIDNGTGHTAAEKDSNVTARRVDDPCDRGRGVDQCRRQGDSMPAKTR